MMNQTQLYAEGREQGVAWAMRDRADSIPASAGMAEILDEIRSDDRATRTFYLGAMRGYRLIARTLKAGRWGL